MDPAIVAQFVFNGVMLGLMYTLVAIGFTLFFGVLDIVQFAHGDVLMLGAFGALVAYLGADAIGLDVFGIEFLLLLAGAAAVAAAAGIIIGLFVVPMRTSPAINVLLMTLMIGTAIREAVRLFYPQGAEPKAFPTLLPTSSVQFGSVAFRWDSLILFAVGVGVIVGTSWVITRTRLGLAMRAIAQDAETAQIAGIGFRRIILITFAFGSALAGVAGVIHGMYYNEINFSMGLLLGVIGFTAAVVGGLGNIWGAVLGGFVFAGLQTFWVMFVPGLSSYKEVFAFATIIAMMTVKPTGLISEQSSDRA